MAGLNGFETLADDLTPVNLLQLGELSIQDVKYYNGTELVDVELKINGTVVWSIG